MWLGAAFLGGPVSEAGTVAWARGEEALTADMERRWDRQKGLGGDW